MKLENARISLLVSKDNTTITFIDNDSSTEFAEAKLTNDQFVACMSRQAYVKCEISVRSLDKIGKKHENKTFEFEIPEELTRFKVENKNEKLAEVCICKLKENNMSEWVPDRYFQSQNSFFNKDGKSYARATIRRWV